MSSLAAAAVSSEAELAAGSEPEGRVRAFLASCGWWAKTAVKGPAFRTTRQPCLRVATGILAITVARPAQRGLRGRPVPASGGALSLAEVSGPLGPGRPRRPPCRALRDRRPGRQYAPAGMDAGLAGRCRSAPCCAPRLRRASCRRDRVGERTG